MSLVGPRPERPAVCREIPGRDPEIYDQASGASGNDRLGSGSTDTVETRQMRKRIEHDLYYIENWTLGLDVKILFLTVFKGLINKNAY